jgi:hypothetical protein
MRIKNCVPEEKLKTKQFEWKVQGLPFWGSDIEPEVKWREKLARVSQKGRGQWPTAERNWPLRAEGHKQTSGICQTTCSTLHFVLEQLDVILMISAGD